MVSDELLSLALSFFREALSFGSSYSRVAAWGHSPCSRLSALSSCCDQGMRKLNSSVFDSFKVLRTRVISGDYVSCAINTQRAEIEGSLGSAKAYGVCMYGSTGPLTYPSFI